MRSRSGYSLMLALIISGALMLAAVFLVKMVYNASATISYLTDREKAFWLAEAGLEVGQAKLAALPGWYTDLPHFPADDAGWVRELAVGEEGRLGEGEYKVVREMGEGRLYAAGFKGKATVVIRLGLDEEREWKEI